MRSKAWFWVLIAIFCVVLSFRLQQFYSHPHATGFLLRVGHFSPPENCELKFPLVLHVSSDHTIRLNEEIESRAQLSLRLDMILKERIQPVLYIEGNSELRMQEFLQVDESFPVPRGGNCLRQVEGASPVRRQFRKSAAAWVLEARTVAAQWDQTKQSTTRGGRLRPRSGR